MQYNPLLPNISTHGMLQTFPEDTANFTHMLNKNLIVSTEFTFHAPERKYKI